MRPATLAAIAHSYRPEETRGPRVLVVVLLAFAALGCTVIAAALGAVLVWYQQSVEDFVPIEDAAALQATGITEVYDRSGPGGGVLLGTISNPAGQLADPVPLTSISNWLVAATISTEDASFYSNPGVDARGLVRAAYENYAGGGIGTGTGGSSITQQLVKNIYLRDDCYIVDGQESCLAPRTLSRKLKEIAYAIEVDRRYSKDQVLDWYLNSISYGDRYVGIEAAAEGYFHKSAGELTLGESALLAGVPAAPTAYHPRLNCARDAAGQCAVDSDARTTVAGAAKERQAYVLNLMVEHGMASQAEVEAALAEVILVYHPQEAQRAAAWIDDQVEPRLVRMCTAGLLPRVRGSKDCTESVHSAGYRVTSTLDWTKTQEANGLINSWLSNGLAAGCNCNNASIVTIEPGSGQIMVYVPNLDPSWVSNPKVAGNIDQSVEINQPGSSFKPIVYLAWMDALKKTPMSSLWDTSPLPLRDPSVTRENQVLITNPRPGSGGEGLITARAGLGGSQNVPAFRAANEVGVDQVIAYAKKMGITTLDQHFDPTFRDHKSIGYGESIATGGANIRVVDMAYANATISNMGLMVGVPTYAGTFDMESLASGTEENAGAQKRAFIRGDLRLPGTRSVDPVTVLEVRSADGRVLYSLGDDLQRVQVVDGGSVWMVHSIISDCTSRFIIWSCGGSNDDLALDVFLDGDKIPMGVKTGTQQGATINDTLETWMNGYTRYAATAVWVGNADNSLVRDGPSANYAAANTTLRLFKSWMAQYHRDLKAAGVFTKPAGFDDVRPANVRLGSFQSSTTERGRRGGCSQFVETWMRTDVSYPGDCNGRGFMVVPELGRDLALGIAARYGIPVQVSGRQFAPPVVPAGSVEPAPPTVGPGSNVEPRTPTPVPTRATFPTAAPTEERVATPTPRGGAQPTPARTPTVSSKPTEERHQ